MKLKIMKSLLVLCFALIVTKTSANDVFQVRSIAKKICWTEKRTEYRMSSGGCTDAGDCCASCGSNLSRVQKVVEVCESFWTGKRTETVLSETEVSLSGYDQKKRD